MLTQAELEQKTGAKSRKARPLASPSQRYQQYIMQRIEDYKNSLSREEMFSLGNDAVTELQNDPEGQYFLTEVLIEDAVDKLIRKRLRLPSFTRWKQKHAKLRQAQREPTHWGLERRSVLGLPEAKALLAAFRIPVLPSKEASSAHDALVAAESLGFPVALKVDSPDVVHKSDVGGVRLDVAAASEVRGAYEDLVARVNRAQPGARIRGVVVERMLRKPHGRELIVGVARDPAFGPVIGFGTGGTAVEIVADEVGFSLKHTHRVVKATLPAPSYLHYPRGRNCVDRDVYPDLDEFFADVVKVYVEELHALHAAGGRYLQIDEVAQTLLCDQKLRDAVRARGDDPEKLIDLYIDLINRVVRERPAGMTVGVHMCRGNAMGKWIAEGGYERIAEKSFSRMEVDAFFLEFDSERAGGFEPLRFVPNGKRVVLGLVSTKTPALEDKDALKEKIDAAARLIPLDSLSISPQCGFASHEKGTMLSFRDQEAKLRRVVETAMEVWGQA